MNYYYDFSGQKFNYPLSLSINSFDRQVFSRQSSLEISYVLKGEYEALSDHFTRVIKEHELVMIAPQDIHMIRKIGEGEHVILTIHVDFSRFSEAMVPVVDDAFQSMICTDDENGDLYGKLKHMIAQLIVHLMEEQNNLFELNAIMMELVNVAANRKYPVENLPFQSTHHENYMKAIRYIDRHYEEDLHLEDVANTLSFSVSYTSRLFKKYTGIPFVKYLAYVRIRASLEALLEGKDSIEEIAAACGMPNSKSYTTAFKEMYGVVPSTYRKRFKRNMTIGNELHERKMTFDDDLKKLLQHLIEDLKTVVYEDEQVKIIKRQGAVICQIKDAKAYQSVLSTQQNMLEVVIKRK